MPAVIKIMKMNHFPEGVSLQMLHIVLQISSIINFELVTKRSELRVIRARRARKAPARLLGHKTMLRSATNNFDRNYSLTTGNTKWRCNTENGNLDYRYRATEGYTQTGGMFGERPETCA
jgi:hypothetical protein